MQVLHYFLASVYSAAVVPKPNLFRPRKQLWHFATLHVRCSCCWTQQGIFWATQTPGQTESRPAAVFLLLVTSTHTGLPHYTATELHCCTRIHFQSFTCKKDLESWNPLRQIWYIEKSGFLIQTWIGSRFTGGLGTSSLFRLPGALAF